MERDESMSDYIKREDALKAIEVCVNESVMPEEWRSGMLDAYDEVKSYVPSADVVEVVRCKNCKHWQKNTEFCSKFSTLSVTHRMPPWAFCCLGERKEQGDE